MVIVSALGRSDALNFCPQRRMKHDCNWRGTDTDFDKSYSTELLLPRLRTHGRCRLCRRGSGGIDGAQVSCCGRQDSRGEGMVFELAFISDSQFFFLPRHDALFYTYSFYETDFSAHLRYDMNLLESSNIFTIDRRHLSHPFQLGALRPRFT